MLHGQLRKTSDDAPVSLTRAIVTNVAVCTLGIVGLELYQADHPRRHDLCSRRQA